VVGSASIRASGGPNDILITFKAGVETQLKVRYNIVTLHIYGDLATKAYSLRECCQTPASGGDILLTRLGTITVACE
jgi:hypothetical protein